jgi:ATP-binding cassette subfamily F protein uup
MNILSAQELSKTHGTKLLFSGLSLGLDDRDRVGLIGVNGCGKSTLLQIVAGLEPPDSGSVTTRQGVRIECLLQNPVFAPRQSVIEHIFTSPGKEASLVREYETLCARVARDPGNPGLLLRFDHVSRQMDACGAWEYESRARTVLGKLGVVDLEERVDLLSGGYRKRVALAHTLLSQADLLILDEPTNHLDADTVAWLEEYLRRFAGAVLLVTHDRYFLERVTDRIWELDQGSLGVFEGSFSWYVARKAEIEMAAASRQARRRAILAKELEWLKRGAKARTTKQKARIDRIHTLENGFTETRNETVSFGIQPPRLGNAILELKGVTKAFGARKLIDGFDYTFRRGEKLGIIGPNASGKTTLANIMVGQCPPDSGSVTIGQTVVFGYFDQESTEFDPAERAIDYVKREGGDILRGTDGSTLGAALVMEQFLFTSQMLYTPIEKLSGGERRRLYLVRTLMRNPNFLILDEPANDLDIPTLQALEDFLDGFPGCLVMISHDRYLLDRTVDQLLSFETDGTLRLYPGDYSVYDRERRLREEEQKPKPQASPIPPKQGVRSAKLSFNEQRELARLEDEIPRMEQRLKALEAGMIEAATDYQRLQALSDEQRQLAALLETSMERWSQLAERA